VSQEAFNNANPVALITGASQGLGRFLAKSFWAKGYSLILVSKNISVLDQLAQEFLTSLSANPSSNDARQQISVHACDFASPEAVDESLKTLIASFSSLDVLINNAAIQGPVGSSADIWVSSPEAWREAIQVDLVAPVEIASRLVPLLARSKSPSKGSIINLSGGGATGPRANFSAYATAKAGLVRFSETLAEEVKGMGIRVNCIAPGAMKTAMMEEVLQKGPDFAGAKEVAIAKKIMTSGGASMERVAELALFLAGEASLGVTGRLISAMWDNWSELPKNASTLESSDLFTLRRVAGRDRGMAWADL
jgi:NAD(P)-dependent dehydrogenase (short-subunit alcohol dehydrogenase family)